MSVAEIPSQTARPRAVGSTDPAGPGTETDAARPVDAAASVQVREGRVLLHQFTVEHGESAALVAAALAEGGLPAAESLLRRALPVGVMAVAVGASAVDSGAIDRTLTGFAEQVHARSEATVAAIDAAVARLAGADTALAQVAGQALNRLPDQLSRVLAGEAGHVQDAVSQAARAVQAEGLAELRGALSQHTEAVRSVLSLEQGPVQTMRRDLLGQIEATRRELTEQLGSVSGLLLAAQAAQSATKAARTTRAAGADFEAQVHQLMGALSAEAGDRYEAVGDIPAGGGTRRGGDGLVTVSRVVAGPARELRILVEAKNRARPLAQQAWVRELTDSMRQRGAQGAIALVPEPAQVPGGGILARVADTCWVVAADDPERVRLVLLTMRELLAVLTGPRGQDGADLEKVQALVQQALSGLEQLDEVARLCRAAQNSLTRLLETGGQVKRTLQASLTGALQALDT